jgi:hypothetical protein
MATKLSFLLLSVLAVLALENFNGVWAASTFDFHDPKDGLLEQLNSVSDNKDIKGSPAFVDDGDDDDDDDELVGEEVGEPVDFPVKDLTEDELQEYLKLEEQIVVAETG